MLSCFKYLHFARLSDHFMSHMWRRTTRCPDSNWATVSSICSKQIVGWVYKGPWSTFFGCFSVTFATCLLSSIKSAFKAKRCQSSCRSDGTHLGSLFIRPSSFQQCLVCCCDWRCAAVFTGLQGAQCAELPGHGTGAERSRLLCSDILFRGKPVSFPSLNTNANTRTHTHTGARTHFTDTSY